MNQRQHMVQTDPSKPYIGIIGCSYTHWSDPKSTWEQIRHRVYSEEDSNSSDCLGESYPAIIAKQFPNYNVVDLSIVSSGNDSVFFRLHNFETQYNIKFSKIIWQLTHFNRELVFFDYNINENIFSNIQQYKNYYFTSGRFNKHINFTIMSRQHGGLHDHMDELNKYFQINKIDLYKYYVNKFGSNQNVWILQKEIDHVNSHYGKNNVLIFAWHKKIDRGYIGTNFTRLTDDVEIDMPSNYIGSIEHMLGTDTFFELGIDHAPHFGPNGHSKVFDFLQPDVVKLMKGL